MITDDDLLDKLKSGQPITPQDTHGDSDLKEVNEGLKITIAENENEYKNKKIR